MNGRRKAVPLALGIRPRCAALGGSSTPDAIPLRPDGGLDPAFDPETGLPAGGTRADGGGDGTWARLLHGFGAERSGTQRRRRAKQAACIAVRPRGKGRRCVLGSSTRMACCLLVSPFDEHNSQEPPLASAGLAWFVGADCGGGPNRVPHFVESHRGCWQSRSRHRRSCDQGAGAGRKRLGFRRRGSLRFRSRRRWLAGLHHLRGARRARRRTNSPTASIRHPVKRSSVQVSASRIVIAVKRVEELLEARVLDGGAAIVCLEMPFGHVRLVA